MSSHSFTIITIHPSLPFIPQTLAGFLSSSSLPHSSPWLTAYVWPFCRPCLVGIQSTPNYIWCTLPCKKVGSRHDGVYIKVFGSGTYDHLPVFLLCVLLVLSEARDIASLFCSNWTEVVLICRYVVHKTVMVMGWMLTILRCSGCKLVNNPWKDEMNLDLQLNPGDDASSNKVVDANIVSSSPAPHPLSAAAARENQERQGAKSSIIAKLIRSSKGSPPADQRHGVSAPPERAAGQRQPALGMLIFFFFFLF